MPDALASASPIASDLYVKLKAALAPFGTYREEVKKTSIHLARNSAFLGVHPRKEHLLVTIKSDKALKVRRIVKTEQVSANRWHLEVKITAPPSTGKRGSGPRSSNPTRQKQLHGNIPTFIRITAGKVHDVNILDEIMLQPGAFYVMDRGYIDFQRLRVHAQRAACLLRSHRAWLRLQASLMLLAPGWPVHHF